MIRHDEVGILADRDIVINLYSVSPQFRDFIQQSLRMNHNSVADNTEFSWTEDS